MHSTAMRNGERFFRTYLPFIENPTIVDIGAQDVNGSLRSVAGEGVNFIGVDFVAGAGVDVVLEDPYKLPLETASADVVVSTSCFEHSEMFWVLFLEVLRVLRPDGLFYLNAPANGPFHRYPVDCWRFYPDSGHALVKWARMNGVAAAVVESFVAEQQEGRWNDCISVFIKDEALIAKFPNRMLGQGGFTNGRLHGNEALINEREGTEDQLAWGWVLSKAVSRLFTGKN